MFSSMLVMAMMPIDITCNNNIGDAYRSMDSKKIQRSYNIDEWPDIVCKKFSENYTKLDLTVLTGTQRIFIEDESVDIKGNFQVGDLRAGRIKVSWTYCDDNGRVKKIIFWLKASAYKDVLLFRKNIKAETDINLNNLQLVNTDVAFLAGRQSPLTHIDDGMSTVKNVRKGQVVTSESVALSPLVRKFDIVDVIIRSKNMSITTRGKVMATAWLEGDVVAVQVSGGEGAVSASVISYGRVYVEI